MDKINQWTEELNRLTEIIDKTGLEVAIKWGAPIYTLKGKNIVACGGFKHHFALWFNNGVFLKDPYQVLSSGTEGKTKSMRQWRFTSMDQIDEKKITEYLNESIENAKAGKELKPEKFTAVEIPEIFKNELENDAKLHEAFKKLTPGKQKEYNLYIEEAKQEKTKISRIEKIKPMILNGVGLHDKYK
ncbi:YdeI/OmpD-associated family protein [Moheibacter lacus]|uniref:YdeI/OmpD-associated family protein n=1 Tax=Moheibacter lacus TaxID=2745851 RepID=A0A838ZTD2_9FLAO|nr:DUF1801 domain-containing protein [Moheibacter lacus]MBA5630199.1 YdeI/OmpD-associated family protein [Moheibacter lacus]